MKKNRTSTNPALPFFLTVVVVFFHLHLHLQSCHGHKTATAHELRELLNLQASAEGGFFAETFRDPDVFVPKSLLPSHYKVGRSVSTAIYYLLPSGNVSHLHRIPSSEVWHFYSGDPITVFEIDEEGNTNHTVLGHDVLAGQSLQYVQKPWTWFGAYPTEDVQHISESRSGGSVAKAPPRDPEKHYSLVACTVAPAFEAVDFELATRAALVERYPQARAVIEYLTFP